MSGHVFILHGDLTRLACDGWLLPCDATMHVMPHWTEELDSPWSPPSPWPAWQSEQERVTRVEDWPGATQPWLVNTGASSGTAVEWFVDGVVAFVDEAAPYARARPFITRRAKPLLALPLIGTGAGGAARRAGQVVEALLPSLAEAADRNDVDVALVVHDAPAYAAALQARARIWNSSGSLPKELTEHQLAQATSLAERARSGKLVLFAGAGVGVGANLPTWTDLLTNLARRSGVLVEGDEARETEFTGLDVLDQARLIEIRLEQDGKSIGDGIREILLPFRQASLAHMLLSVLPVSEAVTTNYDQLLETSADSTGRPFGVLPYHPALHQRWLLKMHGCLSHPEDIVLTRSDFLRYDERRAALRGIVQAMLITKHMLFVGFSLTDDNFLRIIEDVRKAAAGEAGVSPTRFGTALSLRSQPLFEELWSEDLEWVCFDECRADGSSKAEAARTQEIFLDYLASIAAPSSRHLLDDRYDAILSDGERELRAALRRLAESASPEARSTSAWSEIRGLLDGFGGTEPPGS
jgi:hypothetical protein